MKKCPSCPNVACELYFPDENAFCFVTGETLQPLNDPRLGTVIRGRFVLESLVHRGPWSSVYVARERLVARPALVKIFDQPLSADAQERFAVAVEKARRCSHEHVLEIYGAGTDPATGLAFVASAHRTGFESLHQRLDQKGALPLPLGLSVIEQITSALARIHDFGGLHGHLAPSNVLVSEAGFAMLLDVGLGRLVVRDPWEDAPECLAAQLFQAPELMTGLRSSQKGDLFSLGAVAFAILTGRPPIAASDLRGLRDALAVAEVDLSEAAPSLAEPIRKWTERMMQRPPERRPATAHQALHELRAAMEEAGVAAAEAPPGPDVGEEAPAMSGTFAAWERYQEVFSRMIQTAFPNGPPPDVKASFDAIRGAHDQLGSLRGRVEYEYGNLRTAEDRAQEGRLGIAKQMFDLNEDAKEIHEEIEPLKVAGARHGDKAQAFGPQALEQHREVIRWEGRSGFVEPHKELAEAYKQMGAIIEKWWSVRTAQLACEQDVATKEEALRGLGEQLDELREALRIHESNLSSELAATEKNIEQLGAEMDQLQRQLMHLATRLTGPLRAQPTLGPLFRELAQPS